MNLDLSYKKCFAVDCTLTIPRDLLMCREHWARVPSRVRTEVYDTWRAWDRGGPLRPYILATWRAQFAVAHSERRETAVAAIRAVIAEIEKKEAPDAA